ncbi:MAG: hypothetical protein K9J16_15800 [Melioribacteraceae bacterium]|nr:hypothetical protein [Melioribacteraceae bacterium]MCF8356865.1 hypothetical protein [Melioribacteraceae bacterium]MCF8394878.1 hypothetical protein [Melioribacteraceae bacterium]MCF8420411.1 hypothetical protein [Melioribacteraceae bacterium]
MKNLLVLPFNIDHAQKSGEFAKILYEARKSGELIVNERPIIINDAKLFAQTDSEANISFFVTSDSRSLSIFESLENKINPNFSIIDINIDHTEIFGLLDL